MRTYIHIYIQCTQFPYICLLFVFVFTNRVKYRLSAKPRYNTIYKSLQECKDACITEVSRCNLVNYAPEDFGRYALTWKHEVGFASNASIRDVSHINMCMGAGSKRANVNSRPVIERTKSDSSEPNMRILASTMDPRFSPPQRNQHLRPRPRVPNHSVSVRLR